MLSKNSPRHVSIGVRSALSCGLDARDVSLPYSASSSCCGVRLIFEADSPGFLQEILSSFPQSGPLREKPPEARFSLSTTQGAYSVALNGVPLRAFSAVWPALEFVKRIVPETLAVLSSSTVLVHAGVAVWREHAVVMPGRSWSGKSSLTAALVEAGATYFSDEYAVLGSDGRVYPYRRVPNLRSKRFRLPDPTLLGLDASSDTSNPSACVSLIVSCEYSNGADWSPVALSPGERLFALLSHTLAIRSRPEPSLRVLKGVALSARGLRGIRGEADEAAQQIISTLKSIELQQDISSELEEKACVQ